MVTKMFFKVSTIDVNKKKAHFKSVFVKKVIKVIFLKWKKNHDISIYNYNCSGYTNIKHYYLKAIWAKIQFGPNNVLKLTICFEISIITLMLIKCFVFIDMKITFYKSKKSKGFHGMLWAFGVGIRRHHIYVTTSFPYAHLDIPNMWRASRRSSTCKYIGPRI